jgi:hypothetical protein
MNEKQTKLDVVVHIWNPIYSGVEIRGLQSKVSPRQKHETLSEKETKAQKAGGMIHSTSVCLASMSPWVQSPIPSLSLSLSLSLTHTHKNKPWKPQQNFKWTEEKL